MTHHQAKSVREFLHVFFGNNLMNAWIEPSDAVVVDGWTVYFCFGVDGEEYHINSVAQMQSAEFWENLLTVSKNLV